MPEPGRPTGQVEWATVRADAHLVERQRLLHDPSAGPGDPGVGPEVVEPDVYRRAIGHCPPPPWVSHPDLKRPADLNRGTAGGRRPRPFAHPGRPRARRRTLGHRGLGRPTGRALPGG